eukprot:CAMPEP_0118712414 /NCGR_PEP_ID=MMETSP0800-20121206/24794_1 /TAXON_ID=210618 ORGANISM="Striatella unipunctata, Strain CCMP2910" /NCGR_SAMPLE_ID=MMETSP0800 /ASSEMBLY_ACC=CAM_ASM_000638 /LENGTH=240 /DNA_ID=CAMNT_0006617445 /DNA_START=558 /DNA_END=1280 /DNA_ORIENTATION=+
MVIFTLALAGAATGWIQRYLTVLGAGGACAVLASNLGSRAWKFLGWKHVPSTNFLGRLFAFFCSVIAGICLPHLGHREMQIGGKVAMETILKTSVIVGAGFVLSDYDRVQEFIIVGSEVCDQQFVNIAVGLWWCISLMLSICMFQRNRPRQDEEANFDEALVQETQSSPLGYTIPSLPNYLMDPSLIYRDEEDKSCCTVGMEALIGIAMAFTGGSTILFTAFTEIDDSFSAVNATGLFFS